MERVVFLVEESGDRIACLLNPETFVVRRRAGVRARRSAVGQLSGSAMADDPLIYTGGGSTELDLDLLFDVSLMPVDASVYTEDVRDLTGPLTGLAENLVDSEGYGRPPLVRFIWGRSWNVPGVITAVAERLEDFTPEGSPRRSWVRLRLARVTDGPVEPIPVLQPEFPDDMPTLMEPPEELPGVLEPDTDQPGIDRGIPDRIEELPGVLDAIESEVADAVEERLA